MEKTSQKPRVVILGAGFGGLTAARAMADTAHVTVVDRHNFQTFLPFGYCYILKFLFPILLSWSFRIVVLPPTSFS